MDLTLNLKQTQTLSPQMIQSMKVLQMGTMELREYLQEQLQENPVLEAEEHPPVQAPRQEDRDQTPQKLEWLHSTDVQNDWYNREDTQNIIELVPGALGADLSESSLYDHLRTQICFEELSPAMAAAVECVLQSLNGIGRLEEQPEDLAACAGVSVSVIRQAIQMVQALEPAGVAAHDLSECLCIQLIRRGETGLALTIARDYLKDVGQNHYNHIAQAAGVSCGRVRAACQLIRTLDPRPGASFVSWERPGYIIPDLSVISTEGQLEVILNDPYIPSLRVSSYYHQLMASTDDAQVQDYLSVKVRQAKWVIQNIEQRRAALLACARCVLSRQADFFRLGPGHLHPFSLADAAAAMDVHESTVSRTIRNKYLQCAYGVFPLKYFFSRALPAANGTHDVSASQAKSALRTLIDGEDKRNPLSDQKLSQMLAVQGVRLSRRTVAKYRDELGVPSASGRKEGTYQ